jgi:hypothetical protein
MTSIGCANYCSGQGYTIAGTENAGQCFCGNSLSDSEPIPASRCNSPCVGDASQICGGPAALSIMSLNGATKLKRDGLGL